MLKYGIILGFLSTIATVLIISLLKEASISIPVGCGLVSGLIMVYWFPRSQKRAPTSKEYIKIISIYAIFMAIVTFLPLLSATTYTIPGLITLGMYALAYPVFFSLIFNAKYVNAQLTKEV